LARTASAAVQVGQLGLGQVALDHARRLPARAGPGDWPTNHSAVAVFDDAALADGTALYAELALRRLARARSGTAPC
jgi:hypothetical protein